MLPVILHPDSLGRGLRGERPAVEDHPLSQLPSVRLGLLGERPAEGEPAEEGDSLAIQIVVERIRRGDRPAEPPLACRAIDVSSTMSALFPRMQNSPPSLVRVVSCRPASPWPDRVDGREFLLAVCG